MARTLPRSLTDIKNTVKNNLSRVSLAGLMAAGAMTVAMPALADPIPTEEKPVIAAQAAADTQKAAQQNAPRKALRAADLLRVAESQIGVAENANGGGTPYHAWYMSSQRAKETVARDGGKISDYANAPWCAMFISWLGEKTGMRHTVGWDAYTVTYAQWFEANGRWGDTPRPGAIVFFDWDGSDSIAAIDHVGIVKKDNGDGTITTIEGNTGNGKVEERIRPISQVVGYGYPEYAG